MSNPPVQPYAPLPLTNDDHISDSLYNAPRDSGPPSPGFHTPLVGNQSLPGDDDIPPGAARPRFLGHAAYGDEIRASYASSHNSIDRNSEFNSSVYALNEGGAPPLSQYGQYSDDPTNDRSAMSMSPMGKSRYMNEKNAAYAPPRKRRKVIIWAIIISAILLIAAVLIPLYFAIIKPKFESNSNSSKGSGDSNKGKDDTDNKNGNKPAARIVSGGDGTQVTMDDGTKFTYKNSFGGHWYWDEEDPFNNGAKPQEWSPGLNETFRYGTDRIRGVNIGGWLVLEPFICPAMFEPHISKTPSAIDEYTLHQHITADVLEKHYQTFITEKDFADIAGAGLNYVRLPIPYWAVQTLPEEPFHGLIQWKYVVKAIGWARKYGLRINLDLHAVPGSQNGWNHSGKLGTVNWLLGPMGIANAQRTLSIIRVITQFISQDQYKDVVTMFGIINEPQEFSVGRVALESFNYEAYRMIREITGIGEGKGPWISLHDGFSPRAQWANFLPNADRISIDSHPYISFGDQSNNPTSFYRRIPCTNWGRLVNASLTANLLPNAGEFSNGHTDCGLWLNGVNQGMRYEGNYINAQTTRIGSCDDVTSWESWSATQKQDMKNLALSNMDALQHYFFWTWKIGASDVQKRVATPHWSYKLGLDNGWMPLDPREADGACGNTDPYTGPLAAAATGGVGAGSIPASATNALVWPPAALITGGPAASLPSYTPTGVIPTLAGPTFTFASATSTPDVGNGWANPADTAGMMVPISGCTYPDPWVGPDTAPPPVCS